MMTKMMSKIIENLKKVIFDVEGMPSLSDYDEDDKSQIIAKIEAVIRDLEEFIDKEGNENATN